MPHVPCCQDQRIACVYLKAAAIRETHGIVGHGLSFAFHPRASAGN